MKSTKTPLKVVSKSNAPLGDLSRISLQEQPEEKPKNQDGLFTRIKQRINLALDSTPVTILFSLITIYALFADDVRQLIRDKSCDTTFFAITSVCLGMFSLEILLSSIAKPKYFLSFFFWLDILSTFSLVFDIGWISDAMFDTGSSSQGAANAAQLARAGRASRVGTRAGRIVRIVRLIRLIRIVKLYKAAQSTLYNTALNQPNAEQEANDDEVAGAKSPASALNNKISMSKNFLGSPDEIEETHKNRKASSNQHAEKDRKPGNFAVASLQVLQVKPIDEPLADQEQSPKKGNRKSSQMDHLRQPEEKDRRKSGHGDFPHIEELHEIQFRDLDNLESPGEKEEEKGPSRTNLVNLPEETNVGKKLSNLTTKRVITVVMSVLITIPVFSVDIYLSSYTTGESGLRTIWLMYRTGSPNSFNYVLQDYINAHSGLRNPLIGIDILGTKYFSSNETDENNLRDSEKQYYNIQSDQQEDKGYSVFSIRADTELNAILSIVRTIFVTLVLTAAALSFSKDANDLVLQPIESMLDKVGKIAENPLAAAQIEEEEALLYEELAKQGKLKDFMKKKEGNYETNILEKTILKLGALLAIGFGEAGSNIVAQNMSKSGEVDPMIPGKKIIGIFGFCDIRNFTDATEVLQEGVMVFVNEIAEIVHGTINEYSGAANKNIGDAFLLVWKFPDDEIEADPNDPSSLVLKRGVRVSQLADMSVISFLKVVAGILKSKKLEKYRHNEGLNQRLPNYSVKMGFGLHVGWAIEGAIGSEYKIDASYLSPNVNMASRLEAATKQFGVPILISGSLYQICTLETKKQLRQIDRVTVKGSNQPIDLFTCDVDLTKIAIDKTEKDSSNLSSTEKKKARVESRNKRDDLREKAFSEKIRVAKAFSADKDLMLMRQPFTRDFYTTFRDGFLAYTNGDWTKAREAFEITSTLIPGHKDGPSATLLSVMKETDFKAPYDWRGYRELTEK